MSPAFSFFPLAFFPLTKLVPSPSGLPATKLVPIPSGFPATKFPLPCGPVLGVFPAVGECGATTMQLASSIMALHLFMNSFRCNFTS